MNLLHSHKIGIFFAPLLCLALLSGCAQGTVSSLSSGEGSGATSSLSGTRMAVGDLLKKFANHNGTNYVTFDLLAATNQKSSISTALTSTKPAVFIYYLASGFEYDFDAASGWATTLSDFGTITVPSGLKNEAGVYPYTVEKSASGHKNMVLGSKSSFADAYGYATPAYLSDNAVKLAPLFAQKSESVNALTDVTEVLALAKALSVYGVLAKALPNLVYESVELEYTAASTAYNFKFYAYLNASEAQSGANRYLAATASLRNFDKTVCALLTAYPQKVSAVALESVSLAVSASSTLTAYLTGGQYDHIRWAIADPTLASFSSETTSENTVSLNALKAGTTTVNAYVYSSASESESTLIASGKTTLKVS